MLKRVTKVTSLLVIASSIVSMVPAMAADIKKLDANEGTIYGAKVKVGKLFIDAELNGEDEAIYYIKDGKYTKLDKAEPGDEITELIDDRYLEMAQGDYYIDLTTGKRTDEDIAGNKADDVATTLKKKIKNDNDGRFAESEYTGKLLAKDSETIFGVIGADQFSYELKNPLVFSSHVKSKSHLYTNYGVEGAYFDGDYSLGRLGVVTTGCSVTVGGSSVKLEDKNIIIKNTEDTYEIKDTAGNTYEIKALVENPKSEGESTTYLSRSVDLSIWIKKQGQADSTYTNITDKVEFGSQNNHHAVPVDNTDGGYGYYTRVMQKNSKEVASDDIAGIKYPKSTTLYFATDEDGVDMTSKMLGYGDTFVWAPSYGQGKIKGQTIKYKSSNGYNYLDIEDADEIDVEYTDINDAWGTYAFTIGCGDLYCLSDGYIKKFDAKTDKFIKLYKVDGSMNKISVSLEYNMVVWNEDDKVYSVVDLPLPWETANATASKDDKTTAVAQDTTSAKVGWNKGADGTWTYTQADGTKKTGWLKDGSTWYYLKADGIMATGWQNVGGVWYYLNESGAMLANTTVDGYALGNDGAWIK